MSGRLDSIVAAHAAADLAGAGLPWLAALRHQALERYAACGLPTPRDEDWKYTRVDAWESKPFALAAATDSVPPPLGAGPRLVFVNGHHVPAPSAPLPPGVTLRPLGAALADAPLENWLGRLADPASDGFAALNAAFFADGAYLHLAGNCRPEEPLWIEFHQHGNGMACPRLLVVAEAGSRASLVEFHGGSGDHLANGLSEIHLGRDAELEHLRLQADADSAWHIGALRVEQAAGSRLVSHSLALGAAQSRVAIATRLTAPHATAELNGLCLTTGRRHADHHTLIDHQAPDCRSDELYKSVLDGASRCVFNGRVVVRPDAQRSDARQVSRNLLLSPGAEVDTKPQLEIWADDVRCSHGATVGQLDADQLFYLRARGVDDAAARALLTRAFAGEVLDRIRVAPLADALRRRVGTVLGGSGLEAETGR